MLARELKSAENALAEESSDTNFERLLSIREQMSENRALDALIEGFGVASGRPVKSF